MNCDWCGFHTSGTNPSLPLSVQSPMINSWISWAHTTQLPTKASTECWYKTCMLSVGQNCKTCLKMFEIHVQLFNQVPYWLRYRIRWYGIWCAVVLKCPLTERDSADMDGKKGTTHFRNWLSNIVKYYQRFWLRLIQISSHSQCSKPFYSSYSSDIYISIAALHDRCRSKRSTPCIFSWS